MPRVLKKLMATTAAPLAAYDPALTPLVCTPDEASRITKYSASWLAKARIFGGGPKFIKRPRKILYEIAELHRWMAAQNQFASTAEYARASSKEVAA